MRIATFNVQNLRLRQRDGSPHLDGAVDGDARGLPRAMSLDIADRRRTAKLIAEADADVVALQEVFDTDALDFFHDRFLVPAGAEPYPHRICLPGNDGRGLNVAALSRIAPQRADGHANLTGSDLGLRDLPDDLIDRPLFRRDCLRLDLRGITLFICHFKAPYPDPETAWTVRNAEARGVRALIEHAFSDPAEAEWIALGDFNEHAAQSGAATSAVAPLTEGFGVDLSDRLAPDSGWTFETPDTHRRSRPDRIIVSPRLARHYPLAIPRILRPQAGPGTRPHASDHALIYIDFPGLAGF